MPEVQRRLWRSPSTTQNKMKAFLTLWLYLALMICLIAMMLAIYWGDIPHFFLFGICLCITGVKIFQHMEDE